MQFHELNSSKKFRLIWALTWRFVLLSMAARGLAAIAYFLIGILGGTVVSAMHVDADAYDRLWKSLGFLANLVIQISAIVGWMYWILARRVGQFEIVLFERP